MKSGQEKKRFNMNKMLLITPYVPDVHLKNARVHWFTCLCRISKAIFPIKTHFWYRQLDCLFGMKSMSFLFIPVSLIVYYYRTYMSVSRYNNNFMEASKLAKVSAYPALPILLNYFPYLFSFFCYCFALCG